MTRMISEPPREMNSLSEDTGDKDDPNPRKVS